MSDKLKKYIANNEEHFSASPRAGHLNRFKKLQQKQVKPITNKKFQIPAIMQVAAAFILVFGIGWLFFNLGKMQNSPSFASVENTPVIFSEELAEAESFFTQQVDLKKKEVLAFSTSDNGATSQIMLELEKLELQYLDLKEELAINSNNSQIINAMIENYRMRLSVLEKLLHQLKKSNTIKKQHHDEIQA